jgi:hypothetical protein
MKIWRKEVAGTFCNFCKVARAKLEFIFKNQESSWNFHGLRLDFTEGQGSNCKISGDFPVRNFIFNGKIRWTRSTIHGPWVSPVHDGPRIGPRRLLTGVRPSSRSGPRQLTSGGAMERGLHRESISGLTGARATVWRPGDDGEEAMVVALGGAGACERREEKESGERCGEDQVGHRPFIGGGVRWTSRLHGRHQCLGLKAPITGVKRGKGRLLGLLVAVGERGQRTWRGWRSGEAAA